MRKLGNTWKYKNSYLGNRRDVGNVLEYMGYGYLRRGDYSNAYGAYEAAVENYRGTIDEEVDGNTNCKDNMAKIKEKQMNPDLNVGFQKPRFNDNWDSLFYPSVQEISQ